MNLKGEHVHGVVLPLYNGEWILCKDRLPSAEEFERDGGARILLARRFKNGLAYEWVYEIADQYPERWDKSELGMPFAWTLLPAPRFLDPARSESSQCPDCHPEPRDPSQFCVKHRPQGHWNS